MNKVIKVWTICIQESVECMADLFIETVESLPILPDGRKQFNPCECAKRFMAHRRSLNGDRELWIFPDASSVELVHVHQRDRTLEVI